MHAQYCEINIIKTSFTKLKVFKIKKNVHKRSHFVIVLLSIIAKRGDLISKLMTTCIYRILQ